MGLFLKSSGVGAEVLLSEIARQASGLRNAVASSSLRGHHLILNYHSITSILINVARSAFGMATVRCGARALTACSATLQVRRC